MHWQDHQILLSASALTPVLVHTLINASCAPLGFGGGIDLAGILEFVDSGHNLLLAGGTDVSDSIRALAAEVGVDMDERGTRVFDHFSFAHTAEGNADHTLLVAKDIVSAPGIFGSTGIKVNWAPCKCSMCTQCLCLCYCLVLFSIKPPSLPPP